MNKRLIIGNWKMNNTITEALKLIAGLEHHLKTISDVDVAVAPPFTAIYSVGVALQDTAFKLAAQNCHWEDRGAYTGEISPAFLADLNCSYVLVGHSERRHHNSETEAETNLKLNSIIRHDMNAVLCVGETAEDREQDRTWETLGKQLKGGLANLHLREMEKVVIAYEPVWAIGTGKVATPDQIVEVHSFLRNLVGKLFDGPTAAQIRIIYGGSINSANSENLSRQKEINGCLVGGASLDAESFASIIRAMGRPQPAN